MREFSGDRRVLTTKELQSIITRQRSPEALAKRVIKFFMAPGVIRPQTRISYTPGKNERVGTVKGKSL